jgi:5-(carboxyamino)imidazole ribonucleotide mutase
MRVAVIMGSHSDLEIVSKTEAILTKFGIAVEMHILSAHRTPNEVMKFVSSAEDNGFEVIIGAAGKAAHLPGVIASYTTLPVIGLPLKGGVMDGLDALLAVVQMPAGIPVATVAVNGAENAGLLAVHILSIKYPEINQKLKAYREQMRTDVLDKDHTYGRVL